MTSILLAVLIVKSGVHGGMAGAFFALVMSVVFRTGGPAGGEWPRDHH
ncbi:hypothetical protein [Arthrobacter sp. MA-N2]|nr:hypothetical protein [Arthrobacter sp. MA-N2]